MFTVFGQRFNKFDPILSTVAMKEGGIVIPIGTVIDDGLPKKISLGSWTDEHVAKLYAENIKNNCAKRTWKIWIEETK